MVTTANWNVVTTANSNLITKPRLTVFPNELRWLIAAAYYSEGRELIFPRHHRWGNPERMGETK